MLPRLFYLCTLMTVSGAVLYISGNIELDVSMCPLTYYGVEYSTIFVNFTTDGFYICFKDFYYEELSKDQDCIVLPPILELTDMGFYNDSVVKEEMTEKLLKALPSLREDLIECYVSFLDDQERPVFLYRLHSQTVSMTMINSEFPDETYPQYWVDGERVDELIVKFTNVYEVADVSGCRVAGVSRRPGNLVLPNYCIVGVCYTSSNFSIDSCESHEVCDGNGACVDVSSVSVCVVTGPTIIDYKGKTGTVFDQCEYTLLGADAFLFSVKGRFKERRRRDITFLDSVLLEFYDSTTFELEQGGTVLVNSSLVVLDDDLETYEGVALFQEGNGITAKFKRGSSNYYISFDGTTALIRIDAKDVDFKGLCTAAESIEESRVSENDNCKDKFTDIDDPAINCGGADNLCSVLRSPPFSACNADVDPEPFITTCTDTLCRYPQEDNIRCQFVESYVRTCGMVSQAILENWGKIPGCRESREKCKLDCKEFEFCGESKGNPACICKASHVMQYKELQVLGDPPICVDRTGSLSLMNCLLAEKGIDYTTLHLHDQTCRGTLNLDDNLVTFTFESNNCGTQVTTNNSEVIYTNWVTDTEYGTISRRHDVNIEFSCKYFKPELQTLVFRILDSHVVKYMTQDMWNYTVSMKAFEDSDRKNLLDLNTTITLNQKIWIELETDGLDENVIDVVTDSCWATANPSPLSKPKYDLIIEGCANPSDSTVDVYGNGRGLSNYFSFNMFEFSGSDVFQFHLHCQLRLCVKLHQDCEPMVILATCDDNFLTTRYPWSRHVNTK